MVAGREFEDRRYSHDEFRRILEEATTWPGGGSHGAEEELSRVAAPSDGLTIDEMREIAREVGIDPTAVEHAAEELVSGGAIRVLSPPGKPFARVLHAELEIARALSREGLGTFGDDRLTIETFPDAGHGIRIAEGYMEVQLEWLAHHVVGRPAAR